MGGRGGVNSESVLVSNLQMLAGMLLMTHARTEQDVRSRESPLSQ